jgi:hypothetical protein
MASSYFIWRQMSYCRVLFKYNQSVRYDWILVLVQYISLRTGNYSIQIMVEIGIVEIINLGGALGIIGTMFIVLYFSRKQAQGFTLDIETKILNDLDEKVRKMAEIIIEIPSMQKVI